MGIFFQTNNDKDKLYYKQEKKSMIISSIK